MSRDLDSLFSARELSAVSAWLKESPGKSFHVMRDNPHHGVPMLGAAWGVKMDGSSANGANDIRDLWRGAWKRAGKTPIMWYARNVTGPDQGFLRK